jgi:uncharacterized damage-inducible protein DinB
MTIAQSILPEFDREMAGTRKALERVPDGKFDWKPHPKSMALGRLASHLAELSGWATQTMTLTELDIAPPGVTAPTGHNLPTLAEVLALFDKSVSDARKAIAEAPDSAWMVPWSLKKGGQVLLTLPRIAIVRSMVLNHIIHHRAQLGVYLRLLGLPVPSLYGPTADEGAM